MAGETGRNMFDDRMNIDKHHVVIFKALKDLINLGYLGKVGTYKYQATDFAKQIFNVRIEK